jgi:hypothetical protein
LNNTKSFSAYVRLDGSGDSGSVVCIKVFRKFDSCS